MDFKIADDTFVYSLNALGINRIWFSVSRGWEDKHTRTSHEECASVAKMLAAAPDMAEALRSVVKIWGYAPEELEQRARDALDECRAALAKAGL